MIEASSNATANSAPTVLPAYAARPLARPVLSVKFPKSFVPANAAALKPVIAVAPTTTITMPIHRSAFSYRRNRGVIHLPIT